jgi:hypothetical protein
MKRPTKPCIFCDNPRTKKRGEHIWDNWLNREDGKQIHDPSTTYYYGADGAFIRSHPSTGLNVTIDVVCDSCNSTWMSDLTGTAKELLEPLIRRDTPTTFDDFGIITIAAFAFMKSAVLDWSTPDPNRKPCISRTACTTFRTSLVSRSYSGDIAIPTGVQIWLARYQRTHKMEAFAFSEEMIGVRRFQGYRILVITYLVGSLIFQLTYPRWVGLTRNRPTAPFFQVIGDNWSVPIWPDVSVADWPPLAHVTSRTLESFRERFRRIHTLSRRG